VVPDRLRRHYKKHSSGFDQWDQKSHAQEHMLFAANMGEHLSIDEVSLSQGELYTFVTNKNGHGKKGTLVASIRGTRSQDIIRILEKLPLQQRLKVKEMTLDMAKNMESAMRSAFPQAELVTDRFHVVKLVIDALQHIRIKYRWEELDRENKAIEKAKESGKKYTAKVFSNGDTPKQLLARSRFLLFKEPSRWTDHQKLRASILFKQYPVIKQAYQHTMEFRNIYQNDNHSDAEQQINKWIERSSELKIQEFNTAARSIRYNLKNILNFFSNRNTNANAESFNSKIKLFRANLRGVADTSFFLFRLNKLFA